MRTLNLGILAHVDAGKTSLTERLLFDNGSIGRLGSVDAGSTQTDTDELERQRGITIRSAVASFAVGDLQVNLVDTPGHPDFIAEVERVLVVLDAAILVLSAVEGVQAQTRVLMKSLARLRLPTLLFVNKIDRRGARQDDLVADIRRRLAPGAIPVQTVTGLGTPAARTEPGALDQPAARRRAAEILAEHDDALLARLLDDAVPSRADLEALLAGQTAAALAHPVFFGSALTGQGSAELTAGIGTFLARRPAAPPRSAAASGEPGPSGTVFAIERGPGGEKIAYLRLFSGEVRERQRLTLTRHEPGGGVSRITGPVTGLEVVTPEDAGAGDAGPGHTGAGHAGRTRAGRVLTAGNIARVRGLPGVRVGDRLGEPDGRAGTAAVPAAQPGDHRHRAARPGRPAAHRAAQPGRRGPADPGQGRGRRGDLGAALRRGPAGGHRGPAGTGLRRDGRVRSPSGRSTSSGRRAGARPASRSSGTARTTSSPPWACGSSPARRGRACRSPARSSTARCRGRSTGPSRTPRWPRWSRACRAGR